MPNLLMAINNMKQPDKNLMKSDIIYAISNILNFGFIPIHKVNTQNITRMLILLTNGNIPEKIQHKNDQIFIKSDEIIHELHQRVNYVFSIGVPGANQQGVRRLAKPLHYTFTLTEFNGYKELDLKNFDPTEVICPVKIPKYCSEIRRLLTLKKPIEKVNGQTAAVNPWYQYPYQQRHSGMRQPRYRYPYNDYEYYYDYGDYNERKQLPVRPVSVPYQKRKTNDEALNAKLIELLHLLKNHDSRQKKTGLVKLNPIITATTTAPTIISTPSPNYYKSFQNRIKSKKFNRERYSSPPISPSYSISDDISQTVKNEPHTNYSIMMNQSNLSNRTENNCEVKLNKMANLLLKLIEQTLHRNYSSSAVHGNSSINNSSTELLKPASISYLLNSSQYAYPEVSTFKKGEPLTSINKSYGENKPLLSNDNNNSQTTKQYKVRSYHSTYQAHFQATDWEDSAMHNGAILMFAMKSHSGLSINKMYFSSRNITNISNKNTASNEITTNHTTGDMDISSKMSNSWYKHDLFDHWYSGSYKYVLFELWSNNNPVVQLKFNARYSDKYTWFNKLFLKTSYPWNEYELLEKAKFILTRYI
ncbi:unnamed protein product [Schistosoma margrebowiei]|uniref:Uncharacterized protein n=1 Tax=Schistosoma margrebowiei TaxID=48269 RepID=A0A3P8ATD2_9TREM|nr:unnamed protein product [Schistosoma margrebowiei]